MNDIKELNNDITILENLKAEILDNINRKKEVVKILDVHPNFTVTRFIEDFNKFKILKQFIQDTFMEEK